MAQRWSLQPIGALAGVVGVGRNLAGEERRDQEDQHQKPAKRTERLAADEPRHVRQWPRRRPQAQPWIPRGSRRTILDRGGAVVWLRDRRRQRRHELLP